LPEQSPQNSIPYSQASSHSQSQQSASSAESSAQQQAAAELNKKVHTLTCTVAELKAQLDAIGAANTQSQLMLLRESMSSCGSETDKKLTQLRTAISTQEETAVAHEKSLQSMQSALLKLKSDAELQQEQQQQQHNDKEQEQQQQLLVDSQQSATSVDDSRPSNSSGKARRQRSLSRYNPVKSGGRDIVLQTTGSTAYAVLGAADLIGKDLEIYWVRIPS
jgi:hypothetical protein